MDDKTFHSLVDEIFIDIEDRLDELEADIDVDTSGGVLTLTMEDGSNIILSRQIGSYEIWVAAKSGGFHLAYDEDLWRCGSTGESFEVLVDRVFSEQGGGALFGS